MEIPMTPTQIKKSIKSLGGWKVDHNKMIYRTFVMRDFIAAVNLINKISQIAEKMNHHPNIHLTGYRNLLIELMTHDISGLSKKDFTQAQKINLLADRLNPKEHI